MIDLYLYDLINKQTANEIVSGLLSAEHQGEPVTIHVNSVGGSIFDGWAIIGTILNLQSKGMIINTHIVGIAGSMAGVIAMFGDNVTMNDFAMLMIHAPSFDGKPAGNQKEQNVLNKIKNSLVLNFTNRRSIEENKLKTFMQSETWLDASESIENNLIDTVVNTGVVIQPENRTNDYILELVNQIKTKEKTKEKPEMKNITNLLGINETTDESVVIEAIENKINGFETSIEEKNTEVEKLTNTIEENTAVIEENKTTIEGLKNTIAETLVDSAIAEGKIEAESKNTWVEMAVKDIENTVKLIDSFKGQVVKITDQLKPEDKKETKELTFDELRKNGGLQNLIDNDFEAYAKVFKDKFGKEPNKK